MPYAPLTEQEFGKAGKLFFIRSTGNQPTREFVKKILIVLSSFGVFVWVLGRIKLIFFSFFLNARTSIYIDHSTKLKSRGTNQKKKKRY